MAEPVAHKLDTEVGPAEVASVISSLPIGAV